MVKPLAFKGDKKSTKKRKRTHQEGDEDSTPTSKQLISASTAAAEDDDETWVSADALSDISGPVLLVFPSKPVTCLATDAMGKVHASPIENMIEDAPQTAEPHLVSQVWIATRIVGSEGNFTFKGHQGRYLGCDKIGFCSAMREAISPEETFVLAPSTEQPGCFDVQTGWKSYLSIDPDKSPPEVRGDATESGDATRVRIRMQARFKPQHKEDKAEKVRSKISRQELEAEAGRRLEDDEVKRLKKARREGNYHEAMLDVKVKGKHDKFA